MSVRGPLEGAADWTHHYAGPANTLCSDDSRLRGPLGMLWFRDTDLVMPSRHGRAPAPLVAGDRMFVEGLDALRAVNIYNGSTLWEFPLNGHPRALSSGPLDGRGRHGKQHLPRPGSAVSPHRGPVPRPGREDRAPGRPRGKPLAGPDGKPGRWGFLACQDGTLFGSVANERHMVKESWRPFLGKLDMSELLSESTMLFALDARTGALRWTFTPRHSIRHNAIAIGGGPRVLDRPAGCGDRHAVGRGRQTGARPSGRPALVRSTPAAARCCGRTAKRSSARSWR